MKIFHCITEICSLIQVWMLTGDKQETAITIAYSCSLFDRHSNLLVCNASTKADLRAQFMQVLPFYISFLFFSFLFVSCFCFFYFVSLFSSVLGIFIFTLSVNFLIDGITLKLLSLASLFNNSC